MSTLPSNSNPRPHLPTWVRYAAIALSILLFAPAVFQGVMAFFRAFTYTLELLLVVLGLGGGGFWLWQTDRLRQQQRDAMQQMLDRLLQEGLPFKLSDFAEKVALPVAIVKPYLERISRTGTTLVEVDDRGTIYYYVPPSHPKQSSPPAALADLPQPDLLPAATTDKRAPHPQTLDGVATPKEYRPFIQAELARRLHVSPSTIGKRKLKPDFSDWVRSKDPEGMSWRYSQVTKQFYPEP